MDSALHDPWLLDGYQVANCNMNENILTMFLDYLRMHTSSEDVADMVSHRVWTVGSGVTRLTGMYSRIRGRAYALNEISVIGGLDWHSRTVAPRRRRS